MNVNEFTTLDHIDQITVPGLPFNEPSNEYWALVCLWEGLEFLYRQASQADEFVMGQLSKFGDIRVFSVGNDPNITYPKTALLTCSFHWYAVTACQYIRTVGAISNQNDTTRPKSVDYVKSVIPEVLTFRDKVAAHFAWSTKNSKDSDAERLNSILPPLAFVNDSFHVGAMTTFVRRDGKSSQTGSANHWSICRVHERLRERYWPKQDVYGILDDT